MTLHRVSGHPGVIDVGGWRPSSIREGCGSLSPGLKSLQRSGDVCNLGKVLLLIGCLGPEMVLIVK